MFNVKPGIIDPIKKYPIHIEIEQAVTSTVISLDEARELHRKLGEAIASIEAERDKAS